MKFHIAIFLIFLMLLSCKKDKKNFSAEKMVSIEKEQDKKPDYKDFLKSVEKNIAELKNKPELEKANFLYQLISEEIYDYWKGTPWDFNGTTRQPQNGEIACGYFITNTLTDLGFKIERVKLAQAVSSKMINELCIDIKRFSTVDQLEEYLNTQPNNSVFIIGLDFHTGYILKDSTGNFFLHSSYINRQGVIKEKIRKSVDLNSSKSFMIGNLNYNKSLMQKWISKK